MKNIFLCICIGVGAYEGFGYLKERKAEQAYRAFEAAFDVNPASGLVRDVHVSRANPPWRRLFEVGRDVRVDLD